MFCHSEKMGKAPLFLAAQCTLVVRGADNFNLFFFGKLYKSMFVCNRGDTMHYEARTNYGALLHSPMLRMDNTAHYHGRHPIKGVKHTKSHASGVPNS